MIPGRARSSNGDRKKSYRLGEEPLTERPSCACLQNDSYGIGPFACSRARANLFASKTKGALALRSVAIGTNGRKWDLDAPIRAEVLERQGKRKRKTAELLGIPFPNYKNLIAPGGGVPSGVERKRRRDDIVGDNQTLEREVMGIGRRRTGARGVDTHTSV